VISLFFFCGDSNRGRAMMGEVQGTISLKIVRPSWVLLSHLFYGGADFLIAFKNWPRISRIAAKKESM
jgi:hypothetical protein